MMTETTPILKQQLLHCHAHALQVAERKQQRKETVMDDCVLLGCTEKAERNSVLCPGKSQLPRVDTVF